MMRLLGQKNAISNIGQQAGQPSRDSGAVEAGNADVEFGGFDRFF
jgi:hypothetical protein